MFKSGVNRLVHLFAAPFLWASVGAMLIVRGIAMMTESSVFLFLLVGFTLGTLKSALVLDKAVVKSVKRIISLQDRTGLGAVFSKRTWILVCCMMGMGVLIRLIFDPNPLLGSCYLAIGWALLFSSRHGWLAWLREIQA